MTDTEGPFPVDDRTELVLPVVEMRRAPSGPWIFLFVVIAFLGAALTVNVVHLNHKLTTAATTIDLTDKVDRLSDGKAPLSIDAKRARAETRFILCSRNTTVVDRSKQASVDWTCAHYQTLTDAYDAEDVSPPPDAPEQP